LGFIFVAQVQWKWQQKIVLFKTVIAIVFKLSPNDVECDGSVNCPSYLHNTDGDKLLIPIAGGTSANILNSLSPSFLNYAALIKDVFE